MVTKADREYQAAISRDAPRIPFDKFVRTMDWRRGEHVSLIGPTGTGKTNLMISLLPMHPFTVVFATKPHDATMDALIQSGYHRMDRWQTLPARQYPRRVLWPDATKLRSQGVQKEVFEDALERIYRERGWTVAVDEAMYLSTTLRLRAELITYYTQARSLELSLVCATQRPANVPVEMYDQATHLFLWRDNDSKNLDRLSEINYGNKTLMRKLVSQLEQHQVLYVNSRTGRMCRTRPPLVKLSDIREEVTA